MATRAASGEDQWRISVTVGRPCCSFEDCLLATSAGVTGVWRSKDAGTARAVAVSDHGAGSGSGVDPAPSAITARGEIAGPVWEASASRCVAALFGEGTVLSSAIWRVACGPRVLRELYFKNSCRIVRACCGSCKSLE